MFVFEHYNAARRKCPLTNEIRFTCRCLVYLGLGWGCGMHTFYSWSNMNLSRGKVAVCVGTVQSWKNIESRGRKSRNCKQHS
jgi:hypothetical protein